MSPPHKPVIELRRVSKRYGSGRGAVTAVRRVSVAIAAGEFVAVMGRSGSGKSSLMNLVGLLDRPSDGAYFFQGIDTNALSANGQARLRNRRIGFIFQAYHLMPRRNALKNVELPLVYQGVRTRDRLRRAKAALAEVGLSTRAAAFPTAMSGGEQQRVAIARALVTDPDLIIADEPTGALDTNTSGEILTLLDAARANGRTIVIVTHDPEVAARATRLIRLHDGRIIEDNRVCENRPCLTDSAISGPEAVS